MMTDKEYEDFHEQAYAGLDRSFRIAAAKMLSQELPPETQDEIKKLHAAHGAQWIHSIPMGHFTFGMSVRNLLREKGFTDDKAGGNLDDYYCQLMEAAVGVRPI